MVLRDAYWSMHRQTDSCLQRLGVTANQFVLLALLAEEDGVMQRDLVERASSDANTVRAMLVALENKGLVSRPRHAADRRARCVTLRPRGRRTYQRAWAASEALRRRLLEALEPGEAEQLIDGLRRICVAMRSRSGKLVPTRKDP